MLICLCYQNPKLLDLELKFTQRLLEQAGNRSELGWTAYSYYVKCADNQLCCSSPGFIRLCKSEIANGTSLLYESAKYNPIIFNHRSRFALQLLKSTNL